MNREPPLRPSPEEIPAARTDAPADGPDDEAAPQRGRPPDPERRARILEAAAALFLEKGFSRTSMDRIAQAAGVSKQTVYAHFRSKDDLYRAVIAHKIAEYFPDTRILAGDAAQAERALQRFGVQFLSLVLSDDSIAMLRRLAESARHEPRLVRLFDEEGPERILATLAAFCARCCCVVHRGRCDARALAELITSLLLGPWLLRRLLGLVPMPAPAELEAHARLVARQAMALAELGLVDAAPATG